MSVIRLSMDGGNKSRTSSKGELSVFRELVEKLINYKSKDGHEPSEMFMELPDAKLYPDYYVEIKEPIAFDGILAKIDRNEYRDSNEVETDLDRMFENAKAYNEEGSDIYNDAEELQEQMRRLFTTRAGSADLAQGPQGTDVSEMEWKGTTYKVGEYVYATSTVEDGRPTVLQIHGIQKHDDGQYTFSGLWFFYPQQTVHKLSQRFYENEVVKSPRINVYTPDELLGPKCMVLYFKEFIRYRPIGFEAKDVYICELRYVENGKTLHRIKDWLTTFPKSVKRIEDLGYEFAEISPPLKIERTVSVHHPDKESSAGPYGTEDGSGGDDDDMDYEAPTRGRKPAGGDRAPKRPRVDNIATAAPIPISGVVPQATPAAPKPRIAVPVLPITKPAVIKPVMGTVPWVPTPALPTPIKVSVGKNDRVPADVAAKFDTTADGKLLWFQQPPIDVVPPTKPVHSIKYLEWKLSRPERTMDVEVGAAPAQTAAKAPQVEPGLLESVTKDLVEGWRKQTVELRDQIYPKKNTTNVS